MLISENQTTNAREPENNSLKTDVRDSWKKELIQMFIQNFVELAFGS
jgi:hypothetical protein